MSFAVTVGTAISESEFRDTLAKVERLTRDVDSHIGALFDRCNRAMRFLPADLDEVLRDALGRLRKLIADFCAEYAKIVNNPGWPPGLRNTGDDWTSKVGGPISGLVGKLAPDQLRIDNHWQGRAADAYAAVLPSQQKAMEAIKETANALHANLTKAGAAILSLWLGLIIAIGAFVVELFAEASAATTVVGAPPAAAAAGLSTAKVIGVVVSCVSLFVAFAGLIMESMTTLKQTLHDNTAFPGGGWPRSTTSDLNDGSLSDGDSTDWRMKTGD